MHRQISILGKLYCAHRLAWLYVHGKWPDRHIDHINGKPDDNRISNLRDVSVSVNMQNRTRAQSNNKSGLLGVSKVQNGWTATIGKNKKRIHLGTFPSPELASSVYIKAKRYLHEGCAI